MKIIDIPALIIHNENMVRAKNIYEQIQKNVFTNIKIFNAITPDTIKNYSEYYKKYKNQYYNFDAKTDDQLYEIRNLCLMMSHLEIVKLAKEKNYEFILIFENDFNIKNSEYIKNIKIDFEYNILNIGGYYENEWLKPYTETIKKISSCNGSFAYIVNKKFYDKYIEIIESKFRNSIGYSGVDGIYSREIYPYYDSFAFIPPLINTIASFSTLKENSYTDHYNYFNKLCNKNN